MFKINFMHKQLQIGDLYYNWVSVELTKNNVIKVISNGKNHHDIVSFIPDNPKEIYKKIESNLELYRAIIDTSTGYLSFYFNEFDDTANNVELIENMSREELINYVKEGQTNLSINTHQYYMPKELGDSIDKKIIKFEYPKMIVPELSEVNEIIDTKIVEARARQMYAVRSLNFNSNEEYKIQLLINDLLKKNVDIITAFIKEYEYKYLYKIVVRPFLLEAELACTVLIYGK